MLKTTYSLQKIIFSHRMLELRHQWQLWLLLLLPVTYIIIFQYIPMYGVIIAFKDF
jgi:ABC-type polysaccharide transport system, permease component